MITDIHSHCGRPADIEPCDRGCGIETCHAVYCAKCNLLLANYDCKEQT